MTKKTPNFDEAFAELKEIANSLDDPQLPLEELSLKVERANQLKELCSRRLREIEEKLDDLVEDKPE
jgi:exodeoxyribonuclease VII small subunit